MSSSVGVLILWRAKTQTRTTWAKFYHIVVVKYFASGDPASIQKRAIEAPQVDQDVGLILLLHFSVTSGDVSSVSFDDHVQTRLTTKTDGLFINEELL